MKLYWHDYAILLLGAILLATPAKVIGGFILGFAAAFYITEKFIERKK